MPDAITDLPSRPPRAPSLPLDLREDPPVRGADRVCRVFVHDSGAMAFVASDGTVTSSAMPATALLAVIEYVARTRS